MLTEQKRNGMMTTTLLQVEVCKDEFVKSCYLEYLPVSQEFSVTLCKDKISRDCDAQGEEICSQESVTGKSDCRKICVDFSSKPRRLLSVCETVNYEHSVEDDVTECETVMEERCTLDGSHCSQVPRQICTLQTKNQTKIVSVPECHVQQTQVCGPEACPLVITGEQDCRDEIRTVSLEFSKPWSILSDEKIVQFSPLI